MLYTLDLEFLIDHFGGKQIDAVLPGFFSHFYEFRSTGAQISSCVCPLSTQHCIYVKDQIKLLLELHR